MTNIKYIKYMKCKGIWQFSHKHKESIFDNGNISIKILGYNEFKKNYFNLFVNLKNDLDSQSKKHKHYVENKLKAYELMYSESAIIELNINIALENININDNESFWKSPPHKEIESKILSAITTAFALCRNSNISPEYEFIDEGFFVEVNNEVKQKIPRSMVIDGPTMSVLTRDELDSTIYLTQVLYSDKNLGTILDLFHHSLIPEEVGRLHSFISAWTCLEIFIAKDFKKLVEFAKGKITSSEIHHQFTNRMFEVMDGKYRLLDKFILLVSYYEIDDADDKIKEFKDLKKIRDSFFHGEKINVIDLPLERVRHLFMTILKIKVKRNTD